MRYQSCDCDPLDYCKHKEVTFNRAKMFDDAIARASKMAKDIMENMKESKMTSCNCDASCGENRSHKVGSPGCRFASEEEHDAYWSIKRSSPQFGYQKDEPGSYSTIIEKPKPEKSIDEIDSMSRPWGSWHVLERGEGYKVKRLIILPDQAISLQYHMHRTEHWIVVQGMAKVIVDGSIFTVRKGDSFFVPKQGLHKVTNIDLNETFIAIEVQIGDICSETDIVRC